MNLEEIRAKMQAAIGHLKTDLSQIRTGRANSSLVSEIAVDAYGSKMMIKELANVSTPEPHIILISPWDKSIITNISGGISKANPSLNPIVDGDIIRINIPPLTAERREEIIKQMHQTLESFKVQIRQIRQDTREELKKAKQDGEVGEDEEKRQEEALQELHDEFIDLIEVTGKAKEDELREI